MFLFVKSFEFDDIKGIVLQIEIIGKSILDLYFIVDFETLSYSKYSLIIVVIKKAQTDVEKRKHIAQTNLIDLNLFNVMFGNE